MAKKLFINLNQNIILTLSILSILVFGMVGCVFENNDSSHDESLILKANLELQKSTINLEKYLDCILDINVNLLLSEIAEYVSRSSYKPSPVFSLATAISFCQTIFGRKAKSETGLRTNDFHLVLAPTSAGKEGPIDAMVSLLSEAGHASMIMPGSVSGATAMLDCLANHPQHIQNWVCDEFGYVPDMITCAKGINNGCVPMGAVLVRQDLHDAFMTGPEHQIEFFHGYTYSGHPLAVAAGVAIS